MASANSDPQTRTGTFRFPIWWTLLLLLLLGLALFGDNGVLRLFKTYQQREELRGKVEELEMENRRLKDEIAALQGDRKAIERIARQELGMVREDEIVYQFKNTPVAPTSPAAAEQK